jgi:penicillin-binding protein 1B
MSKTKRKPVRQFLWRHSAAVALLLMLIFVGAVAYVGYNYVLITEKFDSAQRWDLPSRIYSDATPIVTGLSYPRELLEPKLNHIGYHEANGAIDTPGQYRYDGNKLEVYLQDFAYPEMSFHGHPVRVEFRRDRVEKIERITDGAPLKAIRLEPELITSVFDDVMEDRVPVAYDALPQHLIDAVLVIEDRNFFTHDGISIRGMLRAAITNFREKEVRAGGSTLTQQLIKNLYLTSERKYSRKLREIVMALIIDARYSKQEILEAYMNEIYLGQNGAVQINGMEQAARTYFAKSIRFVTVPEAATLAGLIQSPARFSPMRNPGPSTERRNLVLRMMLDQQKITQEEYDAAVETPMTVNRFPRAINSAPYFVDLVMRELRTTYPQTQLTTEGLRVFTTLDTMMQRSAEAALEEGLDGLAKRFAHIRNADQPLEGSVVTIQPGTGAVKALVGGRSFRRSQFNRATQARRQPGSLFKPFVYATAMDPSRGSNALTASSILDDSPISVETGGRTWRPQNYDGKFHGRVTMRQALAHSYNIPAVRAAIDAGVPNVIRVAQAIGVTSTLEPYPSISLGAFEVTPLEVAYAYSVFANGGVKAEPVTIYAVVTREGKVLENRVVKMERVSPAGVAYIMNTMLKDVLNYGTAGRVRRLGFDRPFAGKTGTTNDYRDAWFVGYSPRVLSLVWVGFDDNRNSRLSGSEAAVPIWTSYMNRVIGTVPDADFRRPDDVIEREIDPASGMLASAWCPSARVEEFVQGTEPTQVCPIHYYSDPGRSRPGWGEIVGGREETSPVARAEEREAGAAPAEPKERRSRFRKIFGWMYDD